MADQVLATSRRARDQAATEALQAARPGLRQQVARSPATADIHKRATWRAMRRVALAHRAEFLRAYREEYDAIKAAGGTR